MDDIAYNGPCKDRGHLTPEMREEEIKEDLLRCYMGGKIDSRDIVIREIKDMLHEKDSAYMQSPIEMLPTETWLHQIRIKAERALQARTPEKRRDELLDCAIYCILALAKEDNGGSHIRLPSRYQSKTDIKGADE